ncbi:MAG: hypothetical protein LBJ64_10945 [Deltaproteobacteria bacterium]|jgi:hypothetical protein|nr:hypothetical protein [Deltaproteobacteria bacterium]
MPNKIRITVLLLFIAAFFCAPALLAQGSGSVVSGSAVQDQNQGLDVVAPPDPMTALSNAQIALSSGDNRAALNAIMLAEQSLWNSSPLSVRNVAFVTEPAPGFGMYNLKTGEEFQGDEPIILYCEPVGYTQIKDSDGTYGFSLIVSVDILDSNGNVLGGNQNLGPYSMNGLKSFYTQYNICFTLNLRGLDPGSYILRITMTDNFDPTKTVAIEKTFNWLSSVGG